MFAQSSGPTFDKMGNERRIFNLSWLEGMNVLKMYICHWTESLCGFCHIWYALILLFSLLYLSLSVKSFTSGFHGEILLHSKTFKWQSELNSSCRSNMWKIKSIFNLQNTNIVNIIPSQLSTEEYPVPRHFCKLSYSNHELFFLVFCIDVQG